MQDVEKLKSVYTRPTTSSGFRNKKIILKKNKVKLLVVRDTEESMKKGEAESGSQPASVSNLAEAETPLVNCLTPQNLRMTRVLSEN